MTDSNKFSFAKPEIEQLKAIDCDINGKLDVTSLDVKHWANHLDPVGAFLYALCREVIKLKNEVAELRDKLK